MVITSSQPSWQEIEEILAVIVISCGGSVLVDRSSPSSSGPEIEGIVLVLENQVIRKI